MNRQDDTTTSIEECQLFEGRPIVPGLLVACAPSGAYTVDRCRVQQTFTIGRGGDADLSIADNKISKHHIRITRGDGVWIEDLESTNGTFVNGDRLTGKQPLQTHSVIRCGNAVLVFHEDVGALLAPPPVERYRMAGRFHIGPLLKSLKEASLSGRHLLLAGSSGTGKELAAQAIAEMIGEPGKPRPILAHNAARFSSEEEATSTLFGVGARVFSNVDPRPGLIERCDGGVLFLDEIHNLPERVQRSLLRVIEDGQLSRIGETRIRPVDIRFVLASNASGACFSLAEDLFARLRVVRIPTLKERVADVPSVFDYLLAERLEEHGLDRSDVMSLFAGEHYEVLCLDGFEKDNVRGLIDVADRLTTRIVGGAEPSEAVSSVFFERFKKSPIVGRPRISTPDMSRETEVVFEPDGIGTQQDTGASVYERNKSLIISTFRDREGNISATERVLRARGIPCSRRWLSVYLEKWGEKKLK